MYSNKAFLVPNLKIFIFAPNLQQGKLRTLISNMTVIFSNSSPKIRKSDIFNPKFKNFYFLHEIWSKANLRVLMSNMTMVFQNCYPKHLNKAFFGSKFKNSNFCMELCNYTIWRAFIRNMTIVFQHSSQRSKQSIFGPKFIFFRFG